MEFVCLIGMKEKINVVKLYLYMYYIYIQKNDLINLLEMLEKN